MTCPPRRCRSRGQTRRSATSSPSRSGSTRRDVHQARDDLRRARDDRWSRRDRLLVHDRHRRAGCRAPAAVSSTSRSVRTPPSGSVVGAPLPRDHATTVDPITCLARRRRPPGMSAAERSESRSGVSPARLGDRCRCDTEGGWLNLTTDELVAAEEPLAKGFRGIRVKVGKPDAQEDLERLVALRGRSARVSGLMVDANQAFTWLELGGAQSSSRRSISRGSRSRSQPTISRGTGCLPHRPRSRSLSGRASTRSPASASTSPQAPPASFNRTLLGSAGLRPG